MNHKNVRYFLLITVVINLAAELIPYASDSRSIGARRRSRGATPEYFGAVFLVAPVINHVVGDTISQNWHMYTSQCRLLSGA